MRLIAALLLSASAHAAEWRAVDVEVTAYCPCAEVCCGKGASGTTADGTNTATTPFGVALSRSAERQIPLGSVLWIPLGEGYLDESRATDRAFLADDRTHRKTVATLSDRPLIDLRYRTHHSAALFGRKLMTVFVWVE